MVLGVLVWLLVRVVVGVVVALEVADVVGVVNSHFAKVPSRYESMADDIICRVLSHRSLSPINPPSLQ